MAKTLTFPPVPAIRAPGVYFGLDEDSYHADPSLGSTDMKRLAQSPPDFWWNSRWSPAYEQDDPTPAKILGTAIHVAVLYGEDEFLKRYAPRDHNGSTREGKAENAAIAASGRIGLKRDAYDRARLAGAFIRGNPHIKSAFENPIANELSIFWRDANGIPKKARFDSLKPRAIVDLKSCANMMDEAFPTAARRAIARYHYPQQAAHYSDAWASVKGHIDAGRLYGGNDLDRATKRLRQAVEAGPMAWVWIFYQSSGAPITWGCTLSPENDIMEFGRRQCQDADAAFLAGFEAFDGVGQPWMLAERLAELDMSEMPGWYGRD